MNTAMILDTCLYAALAMLMLAMLITTVRIVLGPTLADRVLALDQLVAIAIGFVAVIAVRTGYDLYLDIALALGLAGFLATAAFARYIFVSSRDNKNTSRIGGK